MSHTLTEQQVAQAKVEIGVECVAQLDTTSSRIAKAIDPNWSFAEVVSLAKDIITDAVEAGATSIAVMGEPALVTACYFGSIATSLEFYQSTTERMSKDIPQEDGTIKKISVFSHVQWRKWKI